MTARRRLLNRRRSETADIEIAGQRLTACVGFYPDGRPAELFLSGAKDGSGLAAVLADAAVVISLALQHGIGARLLRKSIGRLPGPAAGGGELAASPIGAALDLLTEYEEGF